MRSYKYIRSDNQIDDILNECDEAEAEGTTEYPGMSFEEGVVHTIRWMTDENAPHPMRD